MKKTKSIPALSRLDLLILGLLCGRSMHGYELNKILSSAEMSWVDISRSSTYKTLDRARKHGLVTETVEKQADKPGRSVFHVTGEGRKIFFESLRQLWIQPPKISFEEHIGVFFLNLLQEDEAVELIDRRLDSLRALASTSVEDSQKQPDKVMNFSTLALIKQRLGQFTQDDINWYKGLRRNLSGDSPNATGIRKMVFQGSLKEFELVNVIKLLVEGQRTGTLSLIKNLAVNFLHFKKGHIIGISRSPAEAEGMAAVRQNELVATDQEHDKTSSLLAEIYTTFSNPGGRFTFESSESADYLPINLTTLEFLREGCRQISEWGTIRTLVPSSAAVFDWAIDRSAVIVNIGITDDEKNVLAQVNGMRSVEEIVFLTGLSSFRVNKALYVYSQIGAIVMVTADRRELLEALKDLVQLLLDGTGAILTKNEATELNAGITRFSEQQGLPFAVHSDRLVDKFVESVDIATLEHMSKTFSNEVVDLLKSKIGATAVDDLLAECRKQLSPRASKVLARHSVI